jgi:hypothetical protein
MWLRKAVVGWVFCASVFAAKDVFGSDRVPVFSVHEVSVQASGDYGNPYVDLEARVVISDPQGAPKEPLPLFWDGGKAWKFRFSPDKVGTWKWRVESSDPGQNGKSGSFAVEKSERKGSIQPMKEFPGHFQRQDGSKFWFMGDTAWALYLDNEEERHNREAVFKYVDRRASQGFNVLHSSLLSEAGWGNSGGPPFDDIAGERINPKYWQEVDRRLAYANSKEIVCGLALGWGDKRRKEPYAWRKFPSLEARKRYARNIAARYSAYDVYFIVAGEWHAEAQTRDNTSEAEIRREFVEIGDVLHVADLHDRMKTIHPMTSHGSVREFNDAKWMSFGDYQQNYRDLHQRVLESLRFEKPVVNSEYGYFLRDQSGDGVPDKDNSTSIESMRHATWDIVMAGGYVVTGFGTTYFGGNRDPGPFDVDAKKNHEFANQMTYMKRFFDSLEWWKLQPADSSVSYVTPRGNDGKQLGQVAPPKLTYWCLADPDRQYVIYVRGANKPVILPKTTGEFSLSEFNPRTGKSRNLTGSFPRGESLVYRPSDEQDWVFLLTEKEK